MTTLPSLSSSPSSSSSKNKMNLSISTIGPFSPPTGLDTSEMFGNDSAWYTLAAAKQEAHEQRCRSVFLLYDNKPESNPGNVGHIKQWLKKNGLTVYEYYDKPLEYIKKNDKDNRDSLESKILSKISEYYDDNNSEKKRLNEREQDSSKKISGKNNDDNNNGEDGLDEFIELRKKSKERDDKVVNDMKKCAVIVICISQELHSNFTLRRLAIKARDLKNDMEDSAIAPDLLFCCMQGHYTSASQPFRVSGWLFHMIKDSVWYPAWNKAHIGGAGEAIVHAISLMKRKILIPPEEEDQWEKRLKIYKEEHKGEYDSLGTTPKVVSPIMIMQQKKKNRKVSPTKLFEKIGNLEHHKHFYY
jgi:hypothetical protein